MFQGGPGKPREAQGCSGTPRETQGRSGKPRDAQGNPARPSETPREVQGSPGKPREAKGSPEAQGSPGNPGRPRNAQGCPGVSREESGSSATLPESASGSLKDGLFGKLFRILCTTPPFMRLEHHIASSWIQARFATEPNEYTEFVDPGGLRQAGFATEPNEYSEFVDPVGWIQAVFATEPNEYAELWWFRRFCLETLSRPSGRQVHA
jgi:hypothetical protein